MEQRLGVIGIVVENREDICVPLNEILSSYGHVVVGRMGVPYRDKGVSLMALLVDGTTDDLGALSGKLGALPGISVKVSLTKV